LTDSIGVRPSSGLSSVPVATDKVDGFHYPVYKLAVGADGAAVLVDADNALPVILSTKGEAVQNEILQGIKSLEKQLKIMNIHLSMMTDNEITKAEIE